jgi:hypothetical protein
VTLFCDSETSLKVTAELTINGDEYLLVRIDSVECELSPQDALMLAARITSHCAGLIP